MVHALEESWRVLQTGAKLVDLRPTSPSWKVEVISQDRTSIAGEFDDSTGRNEDLASNQAIAEILRRRLYMEERVEFFEYEYYWDTVDGMVEHIEDDWLSESKVPANISEEARRLVASVHGDAELRIRRKMILAIYSKRME